MKAAFSNVESPLTGVEVFRFGPGAKFRDAALSSALPDLSPDEV